MAYQSTPICLCLCPSTFARLCLCQWLPYGCQSCFCFALRCFASDLSTIIPPDPHVASKLSMLTSKAEAKALIQLKHPNPPPSSLVLGIGALGFTNPPPNMQS